VFFRVEQVCAVPVRNMWATFMHRFAIPKKFRRSALVNRPLPSAMLAEIESAARFNWSTKTT
jgi:hypothetical protein